MERCGRLSRAAIGLSIAVVASAVFVKLYKGRKGKRAADIEVTQLFVFPVKSCSSVPVKELTLTKRCVLYDREWCVFRKINQHFCSQRDFPSLKLLCATIVDDQFLRIAVIEDAVSCKEVTNRRPLLVPIRSHEALRADTFQRVPVDIFGLGTTVVDEGPEAAEWLSEYLGADVFLGRVLEPRRPEESLPDAPFIPSGSSGINLQDFSPLHLCSEEGLEHLRKEVHDDSINVQRFRPNILVKGIPFPDEERWETFRLVRSREGEALDGPSGASQPPLNLKTVKLTSRCTMPSVNDKGVRNFDTAPTPYLKRTHSVAEHGSGPEPMFGLCVFHDVDPDTFTTHTLRVGDRIEVLTLTPPRVYEASS